MAERNVATGTPTATEIDLDTPVFVLVDGVLTQITAANVLESVMPEITVTAYAALSDPDKASKRWIVIPD